MLRYSRATEAALLPPLCTCSYCHVIISARGCHCHPSTDKAEQHVSLPPKSSALRPDLPHTQASKGRRGRDLQLIGVDGLVGS